MSGARAKRMLQFGATLRRFREEQRITQAEMARHLQVSSAYLHDVELGRRTITASRVRVIAERLTLSGDDLLELGGFCLHCDGTGLRKDAS